jgi:beta propeller repeat protein
MQKHFLLLTTIVAIAGILASQEARAKFPISTRNSSKGPPAIAGNIVVWAEQEAGFFERYDVYGYNLQTETQFLICTDTNDQTAPAIAGDIVVWAQGPAGYPIGYDIYGYNLETETEFPICTDTNDQSSPAVAGNIVVWTDYRNYNYDIYGYDLGTGTEFPVCTDGNDQTEPAIAGNIVVWRDDRNDSYDIYGRNLQTGMEFPICTAVSDQVHPAIAGDIVVWMDNRSDSDDIYGYDLGTGTEFPVCTDSNYQYGPAIAGDLVVWTDYRNGFWDIYGYDLGSGMEFPVCTGIASSHGPAVAGNIIVWTEHADSYPYGRHIYGFDYSGNEECPFATEVLKSLPHNGSTVGSTGIDASSCAYNDTRDVWHCFKPTVAGDHTVSLCGSDFDTTLTVYDDCFGTEIVCNDDYCSEQSLVNLKAIAGVKYLIRVAGYDGQTGNYTLTVSGPAECVNRPTSDLNGDCKVDFRDVAIISSEWLDCGYDDPNACLE